MADPTLPRWWNLGNKAAYRHWRQSVIKSDSSSERISVANPAALSENERRQLCQELWAVGFVGYRTPKPLAPADILALGSQLGLGAPDRHQCAEPNGVARLSAREDAAARYIPYTRNRLRWHTDGYYQPDAHRIRSFILHCVTPAKKGGENQLLDPRRLYIALRDEDPQLIQALIRADAFTVPIDESGESNRREYCGPVFATEGDQLHMRYTERTQHIRWHPQTVTARARIQHYLEQLPEARLVRHLDSGCGLIAHNVLHNRSAYEDNPAHPRLLYRARYLQRAALPC